MGAPHRRTETEQLIGALDRLRATYRWKADGLDTAGLRTRIGASSLTLGGPLKHLALHEENAFSTMLSGETVGAPWNAADRESDEGSSPPPPTTPSRR